ncbi:MAG: Ig-like domain-containing protein [Bacteroidales bacterium]|jgi:uncharacterized protein YjdB|nr:Ig-like domain-containing protein [Bacteroidales bacterium]
MKGSLFYYWKTEIINRRMKRSGLLLLGITAFLAVIATSCKDKDDENAGPVSVTGVKLEQSSQTLAAGSEWVLTAVVEPADATNKMVRWTSDDYRIAGVLGGKVAARAEGTAVITATTEDGDKTAICTVTIVPVEITGIRLGEETLELKVGDPAYTLTYAIEPANATYKEVTWLSDAPEIAGVNESGAVTALDPGTANITVTTVNGGFTATCAVTVPAIPITAIRLDRETLVLKAGGPASLLKCTVEPDDATYKEVTWRSNLPGIADVDDAGNVTAISKGVAEITATSADEQWTAICKVYVMEDGTDNLLVNPGFEEPYQTTGSFTVNFVEGQVPGWVRIQPAAEWFSTYYPNPHPVYGAMVNVIEGGTLNRVGKNQDNNFWTGTNGNGVYFVDARVGDWAARVGGNLTGGIYQIVDVIPGAMYGLSCIVGMRCNDANASLKDNETVKILSVDGSTLYHEIPISIENAYTSRNQPAVINYLGSLLVIPSDVHQVRIQVDIRSYANPNQNPLTLFDDFIFCKLAD